MLFLQRLGLCVFLILQFVGFAHAGVDQIYHTNFNDELMPTPSVEFDQDLRRVITAIDRYQLAPVIVSILVLPTSDNASFDEGFLIYLPRQMEFTNSMGLDPYLKERHHMEAVFAHEYGHALFHHEISLKIPLYAEMARVRKAMSDLQIELLQAAGTVDEINRKKIDLRERYKQFQAQVLNNAEMMRLRNLMLPYTELFADVVAVYHMNQRSAIFEALFNPNWQPHQIRELEHVRARDFSVQHDLNSWNDDTEHGLFAPVRSLLGKNECWPQNENQKKSHLHFIMSILIKDIIEKFENKKNVAVADNAQLIEKLQNICKD